MRIKIISLVICIISLLMILVGCLYKQHSPDSYKDYIKYDVEELSNGTLKLNIGNDIYTTRENVEWYPNKKNVEDYSNIIGVCRYGYIFDTTSENSLFIDPLGDGKAYIVFKTNFKFTPVSKEYIKEGRFISYADQGYNEKDKGPTIDAMGKIEEIIQIYFEKDKYERKNLNYKSIIGEIILKNKIDEGLYFSTSIYKENNDYYMGIKWSDGLYVKCNEIIPEDIYKLEEYKKETFGFWIIRGKTLRKRG